jgi:hypothetical protein
VSNQNINMKKFYLLALLLLTISLTICKADGYQSGFVILKNGKRVGGQIKLYKHAPWKNQRYIWFKDSAAIASNPDAKPKKLYASDMKFYQAGTRQFVKVSYFDQAFIKLRNLYTNSWMLERVANGRFEAYMFYSSPPEFFDYFFADPKGDQTEPDGNDNAMLKYRIIFKKNGAKHFVNAYSYNLAKYFEDTPQILDKYKAGTYGNQPDVDGSMFDKLSEICNRTIFTSHAESTGIIAAFNDYNQFYAPKIELPAPTPAQSTADLFKPYWFKGAVIDNDTHKGVPGATVSYIDSVTQIVVKLTSSDSTGGYSFYVTDERPFGIKVEKKGFFTQNLTGIDASTGKALAVNSPNGSSSTGGSSNGLGSRSFAANGATGAGNGNSANGGSSAGSSANGSGLGGFAANGSTGAGNGNSANGGSSAGGSANGSGSGGFAANGSNGAGNGNSANGGSSSGGSANGSGLGFGGGPSASGSGSFATNGSKGSGNGSSSKGNSSNGGSANGNGSNGSANGSSAFANGTGRAVATGALSGIGASGQPLSAKYMRYINSSRYKHSKYYKVHMQHENELAKDQAASDAANKSGLLAGNPSTGSSASGNGTNGSGNGNGTNGSASGNGTNGSGSRAFAGGSSSVGASASGSNVSPSNGGTSNNRFANGNGSNGSANGSSSNAGSSNNGLTNSGNRSNGSANGGSSNGGSSNNRFANGT